MRYLIGLCQKMEIQRTFLLALLLFFGGTWTTEAACTDNTKIIKLFNRQVLAVVELRYIMGRWKSPDIMLDARPTGDKGSWFLKLTGKGPIRLQVGLAGSGYIYGDVKELCSLIHIVVHREFGEPKLSIVQ